MISKVLWNFLVFKKYNARVNGTFKKGRLTVSETLSAAFTNKEPQVRMVMGIPTVPMTDVEGRYVSAGKDYYVNEGKVTNPFASYSNTVRRNKTVNVTGSLNIGLNLYKGLDYKLHLEVTIYQQIIYLGPLLLTPIGMRMVMQILIIAERLIHYLKAVDSDLVIQLITF